MYPRKITFRLQPKEAKQLYYQARDLKVSPHQAARDMVIERMTLAEMENYLQLMAGDIEELKHTKTVLLNELQALRSGLIDTLSVVIASKTKASAEDSRRWVTERFNQ